MKINKVLLTLFLTSVITSSFDASAMAGAGAGSAITLDEKLAEVGGSQANLDQIMEAVNFIASGDTSNAANYALALGILSNQLSSTTATNSADKFNSDTFNKLFPHYQNDVAEQFVTVVSSGNKSEREKAASLIAVSQILHERVGKETQVSTTPGINIAKDLDMTFTGTDDNNDSILQRLAWDGNLSLIKSMVEAGASFNYENKYGDAAIDVASYNSENPEAAKVVEYLTSIGAKKKSER